MIHIISVFKLVGHSSYVGWWHVDQFAAASQENQNAASTKQANATVSEMFMFLVDLVMEKRPRLSQRVADTQCKYNKYGIFYDLTTHWNIFEATCLGTGNVFCLYTGNDRAPLSYPVAECCSWQYTVQQELESFLVGLNVIVQALHTNTSSVRSCLLQHLFIDCLVALYDWVRGADTQTETGQVDLLMTGEKKFLNGGKLSCLLFF